MQTWNRTSTQILVTRAAKSRNGAGQVVNAWATPEELTASVYPVTNATTAQAYGLTPEDMRLVIIADMPEGVEIRPNDGLWLSDEEYALQRTKPRWEVTETQAWPRYTRLTVKRVKQ